MFIIAFAAIHAIVSMGVLLLTINFGSGYFDRGHVGLPVGIAIATLSLLVKVLFFPMLTLREFTVQGFPELLGYIPLLLNSLIWGLVVWSILRFASKFRAMTWFFGGAVFGGLAAAAYKLKVMMSGVVTGCAYRIGEEPCRPDAKVADLFNALAGIALLMLIAGLVSWNRERRKKFG